MKTNNSIEEYLKNGGKWNLKVDIPEYWQQVAITTAVSFSYKGCEHDEVEFSTMQGHSVEDLTDLFQVFCDENHLEDVNIESLDVVRAAPSMEELTEIEEDMGIY